MTEAEEYRQLRESTGGTQGDVAEALGLHRKTIIEREGGKFMKPEAMMAMRWLAAHPEPVHAAAERRIQAKADAERFRRGIVGER